MPTMTVGVLAAHDDAKDLAARLTAELPAALGRRYENVEWHVRDAEADPADPAADERELVEATRRRALDEGWQLAIGLTDLPLSVRRRPVRAHVSVQHGVGLVSVPALGVVRREARLHDVALSLIERLVGDGDRTELLAARVDETTARSAGTFEFTGSVLRADFWLLLGMVRANQPARAAAGMSHAAIGALGTAAFALTSQNIWSLADPMSVLRLVALMLTSVALTTVALIAAHGLWERTSDPAARERDDRDGRRRPRLTHRLRHRDPQRRLPPASRSRRGPGRGRVTSMRRAATGVAKALGLAARVEDSARLGRQPQLGLGQPGVV
jgi:hypothetical protein